MRSIASRTRPSRVRVPVVVGIAALAWLTLAAPASAQDGDTTTRQEQVVLTGRLLVEADEAVEAAVIFNGPATIEGTVRESLVVFNGRTVVSGTVGGDVVVFNGSVEDIR